MSTMTYTVWIKSYVYYLGSCKLTNHDKKKINRKSSNYTVVKTAEMIKVNNFRVIFVKTQTNFYNYKKIYGFASSYTLTWYTTKTSSFASYCIKDGCFSNHDLCSYKNWTGVLVIESRLAPETLEKRSRRLSGDPNFYNLIK